MLVVAYSSLAMAQESAPDVLVKNITTEVVDIIKQDKEIQAGNPKRIAEVVETRILPHFSFARMTQIAVAVNWRRATPEQQKVLTEEFKTLLVRTYSNALSLYRDQVIQFKPLRMRPDDTEVTVKSEIRQKGAQSVTLDYDMEKTPAGWKVFDVKVSGVSLITNYREEFAAQVREAGIDGLIKTLVSKNRGARPDKT
jgi:phospholipid transport system substrate-binding protein